MKPRQTVRRLFIHESKRIKSLMYTLVCVAICFAIGQAIAAPEYDLNALSNTQGFEMVSGGTSVSSAGDVNGDGIDDLIIGSSWEFSNSGVTYVIFGKEDAPIESFPLPAMETGPTTGFLIFAAGFEDFSGWSVSKAGDVNGDGIDDFIMGAYNADPASGGIDAGISYVIFGRKVTSAANAFADIHLPTAALPASMGFRITGAAAGESCGWSVSNAGDVNNDGIDDVIVGAAYADPSSSTDSGIAYVVFGRNMTGITSEFGDVDLTDFVSDNTKGFRILGPNPNAQCGYSVSRAGDVNKDGISDVIIGCAFADPPGLDVSSEGGITYVIYGRDVIGGATPFSDIQLTNGAGAMFEIEGFRIIGAISNDNSGYAVSSAGDINGGGVDDIVVGAAYADPPNFNVNSNAGITYVIFGRNVPAGDTPFGDVELSTISTGSTLGFRILGAGIADSSGYSVAPLGDINGDGFDDIVLGAPYVNDGTTSDAGATYIIYGGDAVKFDDIHLSAFAAGSPFGFRIGGKFLDQQTGYSVSGAGDVNHDGVNDIILGTPGTSCFVIYGTFPNPTSQPSDQPTNQPSRQPSGQPSAQPTRQPTRQPSRQPSGQPSEQPSRQPSRPPSTQPSAQPSAQPTRQLSSQPSMQPSSQPSEQPNALPSSQPSKQPTVQPSEQPSSQPSGQPSKQPNGQPTNQPSSQPSAQPTTQPTTQPSTISSAQPSARPSEQPSAQPSIQPSMRPSKHPTMQPTGQPSRQPSPQPSVHPSAQPSSQPSTLPTARPSTQPTAQPSMQPSCQPRAQPSSVPSAQPSYQPSTQPSYQPSTQPSSQPSSLPTAPPSNQPSDQPSQLPSTQPTLQPTVQPTKQPSRQPSSQPSLQPSSSPTAEPSKLSPLMPLIMQPSVRPSVQPSVQSSVQPSLQLPSQPADEFPSSQPTMPPSGLPTSRPSSQPSSVPTRQPTALPTLEPNLTMHQGIWVTQIEALRVFSQIALVNNNIWACGTKNTSESCTVLHVNTGTILTQYTLVGEEFTGLVQGIDSNRVILGSRSTAVTGTVNNDLANCEIQPTQLVCTVKTFYDTFATVVTYVPFPLKYLLFSAVNDVTFMAIVDYATGGVKSYLYSSTSTKTLTISHTLSPPNYVGAFVAGTAVSSAGLNYIVAGMVRTDSGSMVAMAVVPLVGSIINSAELVNTMALEYINPDSFVAGGLHLSDGGGIHAYLLRVNVLFSTIKYGMRYRAVSASGGVEVGLRRALSDTVLSTSSGTKGIVRVNLELYMIVDTNVTQSNDKKSTRLTVLKVDAGTGLILQQAHVSSPNASLSCTDITASADDLFIYIACQVTRSPSSTESIVISTNKDLAFSKLPFGIALSHGITFTAESVAFRKVTLSVSARATQSLIVDSQYSTNDGASASPSPYVVPTVHPSVQDSNPPTSAPSCQPSSSPTAAPSVSPQPTSQPSSSGPTNTYKPTVKPTQLPSARPSREPTRAPTVEPTVSPTTRPSVNPSLRPSKQPSMDPSAGPTRAPSRRPTCRPSVSTPSRVPSLTTTAVNTIVEEIGIDKRKDSDLALVIGGSLAGGLLTLFLGRWFLQMCKYLHKQNKKRIAKIEIVQASLRATDPEQQRIVEEALRQRCEAAVSRGPKSSAPRNVDPDSREDGRQVERSMRSPPRSAGAFASGPPAEFSTDNDYQYIAAGAFARGAYINGARSVAAPGQEEVKPINGYVASPHLTGSPSNDSSSLNISSLHSSERSYVSYYHSSGHHSVLRNQESFEDSHSEISENSEFSEISDENSGSDNDGDSQDGELFSTSSHATSGANLC